MPQTIYLASVEGHTGKSAVALGLVEALTRRVGRVGVFRPVGRGSDGDYVLDLLLSRATADVSPAESVGTTYAAVHHDPDAALGTIVERFRAMADRCDAVLIVGSDYTDVGTPTELSFNARVAANLGAPVVLVLGGRRPDGRIGRTAQEVEQVAEIALGEFRSEHAELVGVVVNRAEAAELGAIPGVLRPLVPEDVPVYAIPEDVALVAPALRAVLAAADARLVAGDQALTERTVSGIVVAAMTLENVLPRLVEGALVVVPSDRVDTLLGVLLAHGSQTFPSLTGVVLSGGFPLPPNVERLIEGLHVTLPVASTDLGTYETTTAVSAVRSTLAAESPQKAAEALALFEEHVDADRLLARVDLHTSAVVTPIMFEYGLLARARARKRHIVLPEGDDDRVLEAAGVVLARDVADLTILGREVQVRSRALGLGIDLGRAHVIDPATSPLRERFAETYARERAHKNVSLELARDTVTDVSYFGTLMVHLGLADGMVSGAAHTTAHTIRPAFELIKTAPGVSVVSSVFLMALADRVLVYGDCAVIPDPTSEQLADIAISAAGTAEQFGIDPRIAMLSYSTGTSGSGADVEKVRAATALVRERAPELLVEGPIQYDAAADPAVAAAKMPGSAVAGRATVFVFPDLNTGNNTYKAVQRSSNALAIGPVLQGLNKPINDLSRGALVRDIVNTIAITAIQAQAESAHAAAVSA
ncbi:phosphate acetyltransferase [Amnibacterium kyonggiense]|uniref:Phosphate acetyltransferase n=1 Tax=Amnibacterium kyonggiense TaxID=595671 RepID=A0A4R7FL23_9MICO|nr:phosphate acetyltransferase [Amnibacterium kyonggiense]TDS77092.1 phosphate acetyltransferase [Amnibacterium kyonggiense]